MIKYLKWRISQSLSAYVCPLNTHHQGAWSISLLGFHIEKGTTNWSFQIETGEIWNMKPLKLSEPESYRERLKSGRR